MSFIVGKVALVTGGASGIGLSVVQKLLENGIKGIGIVDISEENGKKVVEDFQKTFNDKVIFIKADVTVHKEFEDAFEKTINKFKHLDIVINNAGIVNELQWERCIAVDLVGVMIGTFLSMEKYLPNFKTGEEGVIVNTAAVSGINAIGNLPAYCAAKHGVVGLGKSLGTEYIWRKNKVRIMTICPGVVATPLVNNTTLANVIKDFHEVKEEIFSISKKASSLEYVGNSVVNIINEGKHGSVWVLENEELPYEVTFPDRADLRKV